MRALRVFAPESIGIDKEQEAVFEEACEFATVHVRRSFEVFVPLSYELQAIIISDSEVRARDIRVGGGGRFVEFCRVWVCVRYDIYEGFDLRASWDTGARKYEVNESMHTVNPVVEVVFGLVNIAGLSQTLGEAVRSVRCSGNMDQVKVEREYRHDPSVDARTRCNVRVLQHAFNIPGINFDH